MNIQRNDGYELSGFQEKFVRRHTYRIKELSESK